MSREIDTTTRIEFAGAMAGRVWLLPPIGTSEEQAPHDSALLRKGVHLEALCPAASPPLEQGRG